MKFVESWYVRFIITVSVVFLLYLEVYKFILWLNAVVFVNSDYIPMLKKKRFYLKIQGYTALLWLG